MHLFIGVDFPATMLNITATGFFDVIQDKVIPLASEAAAIVACADYVSSLHRQLNQWRANSPGFWNNFANVADCSSAFKSWSEAIGGNGGKAVIDDGTASNESC